MKNTLAERWESFCTLLQPPDVAEARAIFYSGAAAFASSAANADNDEDELMAELIDFMKEARAVYNSKTAGTGKIH